jgi:hypothetical protein
MPQLHQIRVPGIFDEDSKNDSTNLLNVLNEREWSQPPDDEEFSDDTIPADDSGA